MDKLRTAKILSIIGCWIGIVIIMYITLFTIELRNTIGSIGGCVFFIYLSIITINENTEDLK